MTAIVLAGHGSLVSPETGGLVRRAADLLREWGVADEVTSAFWKEPPSFASVADSLESNKIIVVPVFAARGWYVDVVLPRELEKGRKDVEYVTTPPIGEHSRMAELVEEAARAGIAKAGNEDVAVVLVGHGTPKHRGSRDITFAIAERMRTTSISNEAIAVFLDDEPQISDVYRLCRSKNLIVVPNFIALGNHASDDVPKAFGLFGEKLDGESHGRRIIYSPPNLTDEEIARMARQLAAAAA